MLLLSYCFFFFNDTATTEIYTLSLHDALPITLEEAIGRISGKMSVVFGAGRTDAGVHASGQVIHFSSDAERTSHVWMKAINAALPRSVAVQWTKEGSDDFHARYSAKSRSYRY